MWTYRVKFKLSLSSNIKEGVENALKALLFLITVSKWGRSTLLKIVDHFEKGDSYTWGRQSILLTSKQKGTNLFEWCWLCKNYSLAGLGTSPTKESSPIIKLSILKSLNGHLIKDPKWKSTHLRYIQRMYCLYSKLKCFHSIKATCKHLLFELILMM